MASIGEFEWDNCRGRPTEDSIRRFEGVLGRAMPEFLETVLNMANAGSPSYDIFYYKDPETQQTIRSCLGALISFDSTHENNVVDYFSPPPEGMSSELAPFAVVGNGNLICLKKGTDGVILWLHGNRPGFDECQLANSFQEFIEGLENDEDDEDDDLDLDAELAGLSEE